VTVRSGMVRVVVADDQPQVRAALAELVASDERLVLSGVAGDAEEAIALCARLRPEVAVVDVKMPRGGGPAAADGIRSVSPGTAVFALSAYDDQGSRLAMRAAGAAAYVVKGGDIDALLGTIFTVAEGPGASARSAGGEG
jgi:DNA-binding NarL/FixJ family response regulator